MFFLSKFKIGHLRPEIALFPWYLVEPEVPEAHHVSLPSTNLGQLLTQKWSGSSTSFIRVGVHIYCTFFLVVQKRPKITLFRLYLLGNKRPGLKFAGRLDLT